MLNSTFAISSLECGDLSPLSFWAALFFEVAQVLQGSQKVAPNMGKSKAVTSYRTPKGQKSSLKPIRKLPPLAPFAGRGPGGGRVNG